MLNRATHEECENPVVYSDQEDERGMLFAAMAKIKVTKGKVVYYPSYVTVENADSAVIILNAQTSFAGYNVQPYISGKAYEKLCFQGIDCAINKAYEDLLLSHTVDYKAYYDRVELYIGESEASKLPTDKRLYQFKEEQRDPGLYTLLFQYGRYLLISSKSWNSAHKSSRNME